MKFDIGRQIKKFRKLRGLKQNELAEKLGITNKRLSSWERGSTQPNVQYIDQLCEALKISADDLFDLDFEAEKTFDYLEKHGSIDEGFKAYEEDQNLLKRFKALDREGQHFVRLVIDRELDRVEKLANFPVKLTQIPVYLLPASAGTGQFLDSDQYEMEDFPESDVPREANFAVRITGDSMEPDYPDGSVVFVQQSKFLLPGEVGVFILNNEAFIKYQDNAGDLASINKKYKPITIKEFDDFRVVGKVIGLYVKPDEEETYLY